MVSLVSLNGLISLTGSRKWCPKHESWWQVCWEDWGALGWHWEVFLPMLCVLWHVKFGAWSAWAFIISLAGIFPISFCYCVCSWLWYPSVRLPGQKLFPAIIQCLDHWRELNLLLPLIATKNATCCAVDKEEIISLMLLVQTLFSWRIPGTTLRLPRKCDCNKCSTLVSYEHVELLKICLWNERLDLMKSKHSIFKLI